jgi:hypothetical protein
MVCVRASGCWWWHGGAGPELRRICNAERPQLPTQARLAGCLICSEQSPPGAKSNWHADMHWHCARDANPQSNVWSALCSCLGGWPMHPSGRRGHCRVRLPSSSPPLRRSLQFVAVDSDGCSFVHKTAGALGPDPFDSSFIVWDGCCPKTKELTSQHCGPRLPSFAATARWGRCMAVSSPICALSRFTWSRHLTRMLWGDQTVS